MCVIQNQFKLYIVQQKDLDGLDTEDLSHQSSMFHLNLC